MTRWVEAEVGDGWGAGAVVVAKCAHCDDVVFSVDGGWAMVDMTTGDPVGGVPLRTARLRYFSHVRAVLIAMAVHDLLDRVAAEGESPTARTGLGARRP